MAANTPSIQRRLDFIHSKKEDPQYQARRVFDMLLQEVTKEKKKIALLYAANKWQVTQFDIHYQNGEPDLYVPHGTGQAEFFYHFNRLVNEAVLSDRLTYGDIKVLPIATSLKGGENCVGNDVSKKSLDDDIGKVHKALNQQYTVYGFGCQDRYLIGGKASKHFYKAENPLLTIDGVSQGCYLQRKLAQLEQEFGSNNQLPQSGQGQKYSPAHLNTPVNVIKNKLVEITRFYYDEGKRHSSFLNRHGETGRNRALVFLSEMLKLDSRDLIEDKILNFLGDESNGNTHEYSFRTILLKEYFDSKESLAEVSASFNEILEEVSPNLGFEVIP